MQKHIRFGLLMDPEEKLVLDRLAVLEGGLSASAMMRRLIRKEGERQGLWPVRSERVKTGGDMSGTQA